MKKYFLRLTIPALLAASISVASSATAQQKLIPAESEISFTSRQMGVPVSGSFKKFDAQIVFDPKKPELSKVSFTVDLLSADIGNPETETELKKPGWFNSFKMPTASFTSTSVKALGTLGALGNGKFEFAGKLAIKGISQNIVVPVTLIQAKDNTRVVGSFNLKRLDFKIGDGDWNDVSIVANEVIVNLKLVVTGIAAH